MHDQCNRLKQLYITCVVRDKCFFNQVYTLAEPVSAGVGLGHMPPSNFSSCYKFLTLKKKKIILLGQLLDDFLLTSTVATCTNLIFLKKLIFNSNKIFSDPIKSVYKSSINHDGLKFLHLSN